MQEDSVDLAVKVLPENDLLQIVVLSYLGHVQPFLLEGPFVKLNLQIENLVEQSTFQGVLQTQVVPPVGNKCD